MWGVFERDGKRMPSDGRESRQRVGHVAGADVELDSVLKPKWTLVDTPAPAANAEGAHAPLAGVTRKSAKL